MVGAGDKRTLLIDPNSISMLKNYFKSAWRSLVRGKGFSFINIAGLGIGMAAALLIFLWIGHEISFDRFHTNKDNLYEVYVLTGNMDGGPRVVNETSQPLGPALKNDFPEIRSFTRVWTLREWLLSTGDKSLTSATGYFADSSFLEMFSFPLVAGSPAGQLKDNSTILITQSLAARMFGNDNPLGRTIRLENTDDVKVTGVLADPPGNSRFQFDYILPWSFHERGNDGYETENQRWLSNNTSTFVLLQPNTDVKALNKKISDITRRYTGRKNTWSHFLFPLSQWHLYSEFENGKPVGGRIDTLQMYGIIAAFILLIACINFINLSTAKSEKRANEVGIRKVAGAGKALLVTHFIIEAFVLCSFAAFFSLLVAYIALPYFNRLVDTKLEIPLGNGHFWLAAFLLVLVTSLLSGIYPALYLSSFKPVSIFKKQFRKTHAAISPRQVLVVAQFTIAIILIISTIIIRNQVEYAANRDRGYSDNQLMQVNFVGDIDKNYEMIKRSLLEQGVAVSVSKTMNGITDGGAHTWGLRWPGENPSDTNTAITLYSAESDLIRTTGMHLLAGRDISIHQYASDSLAVLLNETAVRLMGFKDPIGQIIQQPYSGRNLHVIGVVKDFVTSSPYEKVPPIVIEGPGAWFTAMHIRLNGDGPMATNLAKAEAIFKQYNPAYPFDYKFSDQEYGKKFENEQRTKATASLFAALAIFISCLGLFGLSAYIAETRTREIGVRKVLGASVASIARLLSMDFIKLVIVAILIASPIAWYAMSKWLQGYSYHTEVGIAVFGLAALLAIFVALLTISFQSIRAARANPAKSIKAE
jgi:ABC-type antimicrobial peptide transport system permease subunit